MFMTRNIYITINIVFIFLKESIKYIYHRNKFIYYENTIKQISVLDLFFIKIIQWFLLETNNKELDNLLHSYSNSVYYDISDIDNEAIYNLEKNNNIIIDKNPINSGTIAIVFKGIYDGKKVIIKTKRMYIKEKLTKSISLINYISNILNLIPSFKIIKVSKIIHDNTENLIKQIDFNNEKNNLKLFYDIYKNDNKIHTPFIYEELSNCDILIMEYFDGYTINNYINRSNYYDIFENVYNFFLNSILNHNIIHSDLHKGNVLFLKNESIGIIDFGLIKIVSNTEKQLLLNYIIGINSPVQKFKNIVLTKLVEKVDVSKEIDINKINNDNKFINFLKSIPIKGTIKMLEIDFFLNQYNLRIQKDLFNILIDVAPFIDFCRFMTITVGYNISRKAIINYKKNIIHNQIK